ncbi:hypothetical protein A4G20_08015 [Pasteurellaceae bacterium RH1A]|nr:hypothetical protein A4G20_08015 [Pasteurellaceae bacterium RH1A]
MSRARKNFKAGDIFPLSDVVLGEETLFLHQKHRLGKVIFMSKITKRMIGIVLSQKTFEKIPEDVSDIAFSDTIFYTGNHLLREGVWAVIGNQPVTKEEQELTLRLVGSSLYLLDENLGLVEQKDRKKYQKQLASGLGALYWKINQLYPDEQ